MYGSLISSVTVGAGGIASIEFASIPQTYTDLVVVLSLRTATLSTFDDLALSLNNSATSFTGRTLYGDPNTSSTGSYNPTNVYANAKAAYGTSNVFASCQLYFTNYAGSTYKSISAESVAPNNDAQGWLAVNAGLWSNTSAITSIKFTSNNATNFVQYSTAYLYGLTKGSGGATVS